MTTMDGVLSETAAFVRGRALDGGPFVEIDEEAPTVEATRFGLETLNTLGAGPSDEERRVATELVRACHRPDGGFAPTEADEASALNSTYYAVRVMSAGLVDLEPDREALARWLRAEVLPAGDTVEVDVDELYYAIRAFQLAEIGFEQQERDAIEAFVARCADSGGGFALLPGQAPDIERTYCCLHTLQILGATEVAAEDRDFVAACFDGRRIHWDPEHSKPASPATMYWGSRAAQISRPPEIDWSGVAEGIDSFRRDGGGYAFDDGEPNLWLTYCGARTSDIARRA
ncbi:MAG TPA: prenyltransferase/squalene oxidase repeat-containing protein [Solirubrobacteraceae bacterium]|jgi:hypothetical protein